MLTPYPTEDSMEGGVHMTRHEISKLEILLKVNQKKMTQVDAAKALNLSTRQVQRLCVALKNQGVTALVSAQRGKPSNHQLPEITKATIKKLIVSERYKGFGPTFMGETLESEHGIKISREALRRLMIEQNVWRTHRKKVPVIHQQRERRPCFGELGQVDGSPHLWFEDRGPSCTLLTHIDDATGISVGRFEKTETTAGYMRLERQYIMKYGRVEALYSDKYGVFRINKKECLHLGLVTEFGRALKELGIELICAHSAQGKGRVERGNETHQDRLVKALRLAGINTIEEGNLFLPQYFEKHNEKFGVLAKENKDAHRPLLLSQNLDRIFCYKSERSVSKNLEIQYNNIIYQILQEKPSRALCHAKVMVLESLEGDISIEYRCKPLCFNKFHKQECIGKIIDIKELNNFFNEKKPAYKPSIHHKWNQERRAEIRRREFEENLM